MTKCPNKIYHTKIFIRVIWPGEKFPMKTCPEQENSGLTHPFRVNCTSSCRLENYFRDCICISNFKFRDSLYLLTTSYPNITGGLYIIIPNWVSYIIPNTQTGLSKTTHYPDIPIWGVPMTQIVHFNQCRHVGPDSSLQTKISLHPKTPFIQVNIFSKSPWLQDTWISPSRTEVSPPNKVDNYLKC